MEEAGWVRYTWLETVISTEAWWAFAFTVEFVACRIVLALKCREKTVEAEESVRRTLKEGVYHGGHSGGLSSTYMWKGDVSRLMDGIFIAETLDAAVTKPLNVTPSRRLVRRIILTLSEGGNTKSDGGDCRKKNLLFQKRGLRGPWSGVARNKSGGCRQRLLMVGGRCLRVWSLGGG